LPDGAERAILAETNGASSAPAPNTVRRPDMTNPDMTNDEDSLAERTLRLADGYRIPRLALGVWQVPDGPECIDAVQWALELGYRHIDTAQAYGNEKSVGEALRRSGIPREDVYITTKFHPARRDPAAEAEGSLRRLGLDYVDLYLVHWPQGGALYAWKGMERAHELGYARSIGVSNFDVGELAQVRETATVDPVVDQLQLSPFNSRRALVDAARRQDIVLEAYSPLGTGRHLSDPTVGRIASELGRSPAQVLLRWCIQRDFVVLAKSTHRDRLAENAQVFDFVLSDSELAQLDALDRTGGTDRALESTWW
jgi:2,5-diketo-D-gluconate reductase A